jgi:hypothetical protein
VSHSRRRRTFLLLAFQLLDRPLQPFTYSLFQLFLCAPFVERSHRFTCRCQVNMPAGESRCLSFLGHKMNQGAFRTGLPLFLILEIDTGWRIFKHKVGSPGIPRSSTISTSFEEGQLRFQNRRELSSFLDGYTSPPYVSSLFQAVSVTNITTTSDLGHRDSRPLQRQNHSSG